VKQGTKITTEKLATKIFSIIFVPRLYPEPPLYNNQFLLEKNNLQMKATLHRYDGQHELSPVSSIVNPHHNFHPHRQYRNPHLQYANPRNFFAGAGLPLYFHGLIVSKQHRFPESGKANKDGKDFSFSRQMCTSYC
jgi:hypothetical protein